MGERERGVTGREGVGQLSDICVNMWKQPANNIVTQIVRLVNSLIWIEYSVYLTSLYIYYLKY